MQNGNLQCSEILQTCRATGQISDSVVFDYMRVNSFARVLFVL